MIKKLKELIKGDDYTKRLFIKEHFFIKDGQTYFYVDKESRLFGVRFE